MGGREGWSFGGGSLAVSAQRGKGTERGRAGCLSSPSAFALLCSLPELFGRQRLKPEASPWGFKPQSFSRQWGRKSNLGHGKESRPRGLLGELSGRRWLQESALAKQGWDGQRGAPSQQSL